MNEHTWSGDPAEALGRIAEVATGTGRISVLSGGARFALGLPQHPGAARVVADLYQPNRFKGRMFRAAALALLGLRIHSRVLSSRVGGCEEPAVDWLREPAAAGQVGFLGCNPAHGLRCIVGGLDADMAPFVGKLGFGRSREAVDGEALILDRLRGRKPGVIESLSLDSGDGWSLLRLPHLGSDAPGSMDEPAVLALLEGWLDGERRALGDVEWAACLLNRCKDAGVNAAWCASMEDREVMGALVHGDFAVWNLRETVAGPVAIDWEWGVEEGVAGIDLAYGLRQEAVLVKGLEPGAVIRDILKTVGRGPMAAHLEACGWGDGHEDWLKLGLLYSQFGAGMDSKDLLAEMGITLAGEAPV